MIFLHRPIPLLLMCMLSGMTLRAPAQDNDRITVEGRAVDRTDPAAGFPLLMVVNKTTGRGYFGSMNGKFSISVSKPDTIMISAIGYHTHKICFADSAGGPTYFVTVALSRLQVDIEQVQIFPRRDLDKIEEDIRELGYDESEYRITGVDAWSSPLTALYQEFSRKERDRRRAAKLWNDQRRKELIQELLRLYVRNDLIDLAYSRFDDFYDFLRISDAMLQSWTQYEMAVYIKTMYGIYKRRTR